MYAIHWTDEGFGQMQRLLLQYPERRAEFAASLREMDARLNTDPLGCGESRGADLRVLVVEPLTVYYTIDFETDLVEIARVLIALPLR